MTDQATAGETRDGDATGAGDTGVADTADRADGRAHRWDRHRLGHPDGRDLARMAIDGVRLPALTAHTVGRLLYHRRLLAEVADLPGDVVECGVGAGRSLLLWAHALQEDPRPRRLWGFDSFCGFPEPTPEDESPRRPKKGQWARYTLPDIYQILLASGLPTEWIRARVTLVEGYFADTLWKYAAGRIAILYVDADLYGSYKDVFAQLAPKVVPGGIIALDEYMNTWESYPFPGARTAVDEFLAETGFVLHQDEAFGKYWIRTAGPVDRPV